MIMFVLLCYPLSIHMSQLLSTGRPISSFTLQINNHLAIKLSCFDTLSLQIFSLS